MFLLMIGMIFTQILDFYKNSFIISVFDNIFDLKLPKPNARNKDLTALSPSG